MISLCIFCVYVVFFVASFPGWRWKHTKSPKIIQFRNVYEFSVLLHLCNSFKWISNRRRTKQNEITNETCNKKLNSFQNDDDNNNRNIFLYIIPSIRIKPNGLTDYLKHILIILNGITMLLLWLTIPANSSLFFSSSKNIFIIQ